MRKDVEITVADLMVAILAGVMLAWTLVEAAS